MYIGTQSYLVTKMTDMEQIREELEEMEENRKEALERLREIVEDLRENHGEDVFLIELSVQRRNAIASQSGFLGVPETDLIEVFIKEGMDSSHRDLASRLYLQNSISKQELEQYFDDG